MAMLHELLAVEKTKTAQALRLLQETAAKFQKEQYFKGHIKTLQMIQESPQNEAIQDAARENSELPTTVHETLEYALSTWAVAEDVLFQINASNRNAVSDIVLNGNIIATNVPVDELMGLESRLTELRKVFSIMPTLNASVKWEEDVASGRKGAWAAVNPEITVKTEKKMTPVILAEATDKHPAQVDRVSTDITVGTFTINKFSGAATSAQKAAALSTIDDLIAAVKQARMRANQVDVSKERIGNKIVDLLMESFNK